MLKAIGFDLWETLITDTPELSRRQERLRLTRMEESLAARGLAGEAGRLDLAHRRLWHRCHDLYWSAEMVFVGDNLYVDVFGAQRAGMRAVHFAPPVRGTAVAPPVELEQQVVPDAVITRLGDLPAAIETLS